MLGRKHNNRSRKTRPKRGNRQLILLSTGKTNLEMFGEPTSVIVRIIKGWGIDGGGAREPFLRGTSTGKRTYHLSVLIPVFGKSTCRYTGSLAIE